VDATILAILLIAVPLWIALIVWMVRTNRRDREHVDLTTLLVVTAILAGEIAWIAWARMCTLRKPPGGLQTPHLGHSPACAPTFAL
jgi:hypothetical protein